MTKAPLRYIRLLTIICLIGITTIAIPDDVSSTAPANPALITLNNAITFYASFNGHATADLSNGKGTPTGNSKNLQWSKGVRGQALQGQNNSLLYDAKNNIDLSHAGSLIMWVAPSDDWTDADNPVQLGIATIHDQGESLILARQGGKSNRQALMAIYGPSISDATTRALVKNKGTLDWKKSEWHLLVVNWVPGSVQLSVDGSLFAKAVSKSPDAAPTVNKSDYLAIAGNSTSKSSYSVDELMILNRPSTNDEVKVLFASKPKS